MNQSLINRYPSKVEVANINDTRLAALDAPLQQYISSDVAGINSNGYKLTQNQATEVLNRNTIWPQELSVKVGAMVMLVTVSHLDLFAVGNKADGP
jgi:hypothetical protein